MLYRMSFRIDSSVTLGMQPVCPIGSLRKSKWNNTWRRNRTECRGGKGRKPKWCGQVVATIKTLTLTHTKVMRPKLAQMGPIVCWVIHSNNVPFFLFSRSPSLRHRSRLFDKFHTFGRYFFFVAALPKLRRLIHRRSIWSRHFSALSHR